MKLDRRDFMKLTGGAALGLLAGCIPESDDYKNVGGVWGKAPDDGETITNPNLDITLYAYPAPNSPKVWYVNVTGYWPGAVSNDPNNQVGWPILCKLEKPVTENLYECKVNLENLNVPPGKVTISFDVYNTVGGRNLAPNGTKTFNYLPK